MATEIPADLYTDFLLDNLVLENIKELSLTKIDKIKNELLKSNKRKLLTNNQNIQFNKLNIELEKYDDVQTPFNLMRQQRQLFAKACILQNKSNLLIVNNHYEQITQSIRDETRNKINTYMKEKQRCECGEDIIRANLSRHQKTKSHYNNIANPQQEKVSLSVEEKKQKNNAYMTEKLHCECGQEIIRANLSRHKQTKRHIDKMSN
jgi:hypothetical protein